MGSHIRRCIILMWLASLFVRPDDDRMTVETCCPSWLSYVNKSMYCCADVHFIVFYLVALRDAFSKVQEPPAFTEVDAKWPLEPMWTWWRRNTFRSYTNYIPCGPACKMSLRWPSYPVLCFVSNGTDILNPSAIVNKHVDFEEVLEIRREKKRKTRRWRRIGMKTMKMILWMDKEKDNIRRQKVGQK